MVVISFAVRHVLSFEVSVFHSDVVSGGVALVDLSGPDDLVHLVLGELVPVSHPAGETRQGEENCEELRGYLEGLVDDARVEIDVGVKLPRDEVLIV